MKNAEMAMEDDYGMIDGVINNGKASVTEERVSVLEQLKEKQWLIYRIDLLNILRKGSRNDSVFQRRTNADDAL